MRLALNKPRLMLVAFGLVSAAVLLLVVSRGGAAHAQATGEAPFISYKAPTGPELSSSAVANIALRDAREFGESGEVSIELARGTMTQASTLAEGGSFAAAQAKESQLASTTPSSTFCFGGENANCSASEEQHAKETLNAEGRASTYLVVMAGTNFTPKERLPRGQKEVTGSKVVVLLDAHTGARLGLSIGGAEPAPNLSALQGGSRFVAPAESTAAQAAAGKYTPSHPYEVGPTKSSPSGPPAGSVKGTLARGDEVAVFGARGVIRRARVSGGRFEVRSMTQGTYSLAGRLRSGHYCARKRVTVRPLHETVVHLSC
jgi:hypothetical protein